jgi:hypothetical protein
MVSGLLSFAGVLNFGLLARFVRHAEKRLIKAAINTPSRRISERTGMRLVRTEEGRYVSGLHLTEIWEITRGDLVRANFGESHSSEKVSSYVLSRRCERAKNQRTTSHQAEVMADLLAVERDECALVWQAQAQSLPSEHRAGISPLPLLGLRLITTPRANPSPGSSPGLSWPFSGGPR